MTKHRSNYRLILLSALVTGIGFRHAAATIPPAYTITDLGTLGGRNSYGISVNASGQVAGYSYTPGDVAFHAFLYDGTLHDLETVSGISSGAYGINDFGQVTGQSGAIGYRAYLWTPTTPNGANGAMVNLGSLGGVSNAQGINTRGQVSGYSDTNIGTTHAFLWTPTTPNGISGTMNDLGTLGGTNSYGDDINASGQLTGFSNTVGDTASHAFLWTPSIPNGPSGTMLDLGTLGGAYSQGFGINASGQVAGVSFSAEGVLRAFLYDGTMHDLGTLGGVDANAQGINDSGQVTGYSGTAGDVSTHAFLYASGSGMVDLNSLISPLSGWELTNGVGINDAEQITGFGQIGGQQHAFLLTPVPEPATLALIALGLPFLVPHRRNLAVLRNIL